MTRDDNHRNVRVISVNRFQNIDPVQLAALQPDIQNNQRRRVGVYLAKRGVGVPRDACAVPLVLQNIGDKFANVFLVIDYKYITHDPFLWSSVLIVGSVIFTSAP